MSKELEELFEAITNKRKKFFEKYLKMPNAIEINGCMYSKLVEHYALNDYMRENLFKERPKIFGMDVYLSLLVENNEDINCYYIEGVDK
jgi:hypothetical protein